MPTQATYRIVGLTQWKAADTIAGHLSVLPDVHDVQMDIVSGTAEVTSEAELPLSAVARAVTDAGYSLAAAPPRRGSDFSAGLGLFISGLAVALVAGFSLAQITSPAASQAEPAATLGTGTGQHKHGRAQNTGGLSVAGEGFQLVPDNASFATPGTYELSFVVNDAQGKPVTTFATVHEKPLHLIVIRRDLSGYQHLHPVMSAAGRWTVAAKLGEPGSWRVFADFTAINAAFAQVPVTLGFDVSVAGDFRPLPLPSPATETASGTQTVRYGGSLAAGRAVLLPFTVTAAGQPVDLEPYLGAFGHLVMIRQADLAYLHVHPEPLLNNGSAQFWVTAEPGTYRLFFDYQAAGVVQTALFTVTVA